MAYPQPLAFFPFRPNWGRPFEETFEFKAWVSRSEDGSEQSGSVWGRHPRRHFEYEVLLQGKDAQRYHSLMFAWMGRFFEVAHWADKTMLESATTIGQTVLPVDTTHRSFKAGGRLVIYKDNSTYETYEITAIGVGTVTIAAPGLARAWPARTRVYPTMPALMNPSVSGAQLTDQVLRSPAVFDAEPSETFPNIPNVAPAQTYRGFELYMGWLNWKDPLDFSFEVKRQDIDLGTAKVRTHSASQYAVRQRRHNWTLTNRENANEFRGWLGRRQGRAVPVYMPTGAADFTLALDIDAGDAFLDVTDNLYGELAGAHPALRDIIVQCRDGRIYPRRITGVTGLGNGNVRLTLDSAIPESVTRQGVKRVSYLGLYRQASDATTIRWLTDLVGVVDLDLVPKYTVD